MVAGADGSLCHHVRALLHTVVRCPPAPSNTPEKGDPCAQFTMHGSRRPGMLLCRCFGAGDELLKHLGALYCLDSQRAA